MLVKLSTDKTVSETSAALQAAVEANHFGVMQVHNLNIPRCRNCQICHRCCRALPKIAQKTDAPNSPSPHHCLWPKCRSTSFFSRASAL